MASDGNGTPTRTHAWETVHVFVSSTFNDMHAERDYLVKEVFPELRDWCEERKLRLVDIDLRWGVSEADATHNQRVVEVCLQNIDRCRPFFLCFLGQRYGWIPGLGDVPAETLAKYPGLKSAIADQRSVTELEVLHAVLAPFVGGEAKLAVDQSFFYLREPDYLKDMPAEPAQLRRIYSDEAEEDVQSRAFLVERQTRLREAVCGQKQRPVRQYSARWSSDRRTPELAMPLDCPATLRENQERWRRDWQRSGEVSIPEGALSVPAAQAEKARAYNQRLCAGRLGDFWSDGRSLTEVIVDDLKAAILERYPERKELPEQDDLSREIDRHEDFVRTAADVFIERPGDFADLDAYAAGDSQKLFALVARAGLGKSTLLANWVARWRSRAGKPADEAVHARFVGVGERSNNVDSLLRSILEELRRAGKLSSEIPDNPNVLRSKLAELLGECGKKGRTIVVIDALNHLQSGLTDLDWLSRTLPESVKLVVSFKLGDAAGDALAAQLRADERVTLSEVRPFAGLEERRQLVRQFLRQFLKELDEQHLEALIQADGADNPLFLKVVLTELRVFGAFGQLGEVIRREFGTTPQSAFEAVLRRLESDPSYAAVPSAQAVPLLFGLLSHSRGGLPEDLLARMFLAELGLGEERLADMEATIQLLLRQVRPFLARREGRVDFFYESFQLAARERYTGEGAGQRSEAAWHGQVARTCDTWHMLAGASRRYVLGNLAQHHVAAGQANPAAEALTEFGYHYERLKALGREDVVNVSADFALVDGATGLGLAVRGPLGVWKVFHAENAHLLRREAPFAPETQLLQLAIAHADTSPVTQSAETWLGVAGTTTHWLRPIERRREVERNACLRTFEESTGLVTAVAASADGRRALSHSHPNTLKLWDIETGACLRTFSSRADGVTAVAFLPDGPRALSGSEGGTLALWDIETGACLRTFNGHTRRVTAVALLPERQRALSGTSDGTVALWDLEAGACLRIFDSHEDEVTALALLPDLQRVLSGSRDKTLKLWDIETGACLRTFHGHTNEVTSLALLPDPQRAWLTRHALSGSRDKTLKLWDIQTAACLRTYEGHTGGVTAVVLLPDGQRALSGSQGGTLELWDIERGAYTAPRTFKGHRHWVTAVVLLPDGQRALSGSRDGTLKLWDIQTDASASSPIFFRGHRHGVTAVALLPDGQRALSAGRDEAREQLGSTRPSDRTLKLWDIQTSACRHSSYVPTDELTAFALLPNRRRTTGEQLRRDVGHLKHRHWRLLAQLREVHGDGVTAIALLPDRRRALSGGRVKTLKLWDIETGACLHTFNGHTDKVSAVALLPDRRRAWLLGRAWLCQRALSGSRDKTLKLWDIESGACLRTFNGHTDGVTAVLPLPDRRRARLLGRAWLCQRALSGSRDKTLKLWDIESGACLRTFNGHTDGVSAVALLPDRRRALSGSRDGTLKLWDIETGACLATWQAESGVRCCAASSDIIVVGTAGGEVLFLKLMPPGRMVPEIAAVLWHPSRQLLAVARPNGVLHLHAWHPESQYLEELGCTSVPSITAVQWSTDGARLFAATKQGSTHILDATTLRPASASGDCAPSSFVSPDGRWRAVIESGQLRIVPVTET